MKNISLITSIDLVKLGVLTPVKFIQQSASLSIVESKTNQGVAKLHVLTFNIAGISPANYSLCNSIRRSTFIIVTDAHGEKTYIGTPELRHTTQIDTITDGRAGSFRGYAVTVEWKNV